MNIPNGTMFAGLHGELTPHSWRAVAAESDAYSLFHSRSVAMGWLTKAERDTTSGLWGMNDAGQRGPDPDAQHPYALWFQVILPRLISPTQPLPLQPFLSCVGDVVTRMGSLQLDAIQILLPLQSFVDLFQWLQRIKQTVFVCDSFSLTDDTSMVKPIFINDLWIGPPQHPVAFYGTLVEWSLETLGWLAAFLAGASFKFGVTIPMLLTVSRFEG